MAATKVVALERVARAGRAGVQTGSKDKNLLQIGRGRRLLADRDEAAGRGGFRKHASLSQRDAEHRSSLVCGCDGQRTGRTRHGQDEEAFAVQLSRAPMTV